VSSFDHLHDDDAIHRYFDLPYAVLLVVEMKRIQHLPVQVAYHQHFDPVGAVVSPSEYDTLCCRELGVVSDVLVVLLFSQTSSCSVIFEFHQHAERERVNKNLLPFFWLAGKDRLLS